MAKKSTKKVVEKEKEKVALEPTLSQLGDLLDEGKSGSDILASAKKYGWEDLLTKVELTDEELQKLENEYTVPSRVVYDPKGPLVTGPALQQLAAQKSLRSFATDNVKPSDQFYPCPSSILAAAERLKKDASILKQVKGSTSDVHEQLLHVSTFLFAWHEAAVQTLKRLRSSNNRSIEA